MRITHINAENFLGIRHAAVALQRPVTLFGGSNYAGKSSLQEAVRMALTGETVRVSLKKEYNALVADGAKQGYAQVVMHDGAAESSATIVLPAGKASAENYTAPAALPYLLDAQRFASLDDKERRAFLFGLMGVKTDLAGVKERMLARGLDAAKTERILPMLRAGFDSASTDAKKKATETKGAWRSLTGETYGAVKAAEWKAPKPEFDERKLRAAQEAVQGDDTAIAAANKELGALEADKQRHAQQQLQLSSLKAKSSNLQRIAEKLAIDERELATWQEKVTAAQEAVRAPQLLACPCCDAKLVFDGRSLAKAPENQPAPADGEALQQAIQARDLLQRSVDNGKRDKAEAEKAAENIRTITEALGEAPKASDIEAAQAKVRELQGKRATHVTERDAQQALQRAAAAADETTAKAAAAHADVAAWDAIGDALAPDGIPGELLAEALAPINERLSQSALDAEWPEVVIGKDMEITAGARSYRLLSESERWRVDAMLAEAVSFQSGLRLLVLDRFDVLDTKGRIDLLAWLDVLAAAGEVETALVFGTLKSLPAELPATVAGEWIANGQVGQLKEAA